MTLAQLKEYLKGGASGFLETSLDKAADLAIEAGYNAVWGAYEWKVRRKYSEALTTTANQAYTSLFADMESVLLIRVMDGARAVTVDLKDENAFDYDFASPVLVQADIPIAAKVVHHGGAGTDKYRAYWFPIPDKAYTLKIPYMTKADTAQFPNLPSYMQEAVVSKCLVFMQRTADEKLQHETAAEAAIQRAILKDQVMGGYAPRIGVDPGWDDWSVTSGGGSVWDPRSF